MSKKLLFRLLLLVVFAVSLSGCSALRARLRGETDSSNLTTPTSTTQTTETYTSVQKVREASSDQEAVQVTSDEIDAALNEVDSMGSAETLNTQDVGL